MPDDQPLSVRDFFAFGNEAARLTAELPARPGAATDRDEAAPPQAAEEA